MQKNKLVLSCFREIDVCNKYSVEEVSLLEARMKSLEAENKFLKEKLAAIEAEQKHIRNALFKPSTAKKGKRKSPGAKPGHAGHNRPVPEHVDEVVELSTDKCPHCNASLENVNAAETFDRYVEDIEPTRYIATKYRIRRKYCPHCKRIVGEKPPCVAPKCRFGFGLLILMAFYRYILAMPVNKIQMKHEHYVNGDETGHRINGVNHWLWAFVSNAKALYLVRRGRGSDVPQEVLGMDFKGTLSSDFWSAYNWAGNQQKCWAHILRNAKKLESDFIVYRILKKVYRKAKRLAGEENICKKEKELALLLKRVESMAYTPLNTAKAKTFVRTLVKHKGNLFRFVLDKEVEATNNRAERALRPLVVMRKISGGNRSQKGARTLETNMSVIRTWDIQGRDFFQAGREALTEFSRG